MKIILSPEAKQKLGPRARIALLRAMKKGTGERVCGHAEIVKGGPALALAGVVVCPIADGHVTFEIDSVRLEDLAKLRNLIYFELAQPMSR